MKNFYNLDGIKTELEKKISRNETILKAWENVTFPTKKDGKPFAVFSKNINGATYYKPDYTMQPGENKLRVTEWDKRNGYVTDEIDCYILVKYLEDENKKNKPENYMPKIQYLEQLYKYDLEDVKKAVADRINYLIDRNLSLKAQLNIVSECYYKFKTAYGAALQQLENDCISGGNIGFSGSRNDIYYMILDTVKERFPHC